MRTIRQSAVLILATALVLAACGPANAEPRPPEIVYGQELCDACGMIIDEARFAAATLLADGRTHRFDDIGDMLGYHRAHPEEQVRAWFVHDYQTETWLRGETAYFVMSDEIASPMGHGLAAFESQAAAEAFALERNGQALAFSDLSDSLAEAAH